MIVDSGIVRNGIVRNEILAGDVVSDFGFNFGNPGTASATSNTNIYGDFANDGSATLSSTTLAVRNSLRANYAANPESLFGVIVSDTSSNECHGYIRGTQAGAVGTGDYGSELLGNIGFETAGAGGADVFANWEEFAGDGTLASTGVAGEFNGGAAAIKITAGATNNTYCLQEIDTGGAGGFGVAKGSLYKFDYYTRGYAAVAGRHNATPFSIAHDTGVAGNAFVLVSEDLYATTGARAYFYVRPGVAAGNAAGFDDVSAKRMIISDGVQIFNKKRGGESRWAFRDPDFDASTVLTINIYALPGV